MNTPYNITEIAAMLDEIAAENGDKYPPVTAKIRSDAKLFIKKLRILFFPKIFAPSESEGMHSEITLEETYALLHGLCLTILGRDKHSLAKSITDAFIITLPTLAKLLHEDIQSAYDGDPAAASKAEIVLTYPSFEAISIYRPAHELYKLKLPILPRLLTEIAHTRTGIDIHPGATIGRNFFIDHGTGVVIGETCVIGNNVKLYQGVTLGAKSFENDINGMPVKGIKRHPEVGNNVVIYAEATILGGDTKIGDNCTIGGNVWLTHSVEPGATVYNVPAEHLQEKERL